LRNGAASVRQAGILSTVRVWVQRFFVVALYAGMASAVYVAIDWGRNLQRTTPEIFLGAAPLVGRNFRDGWDWRLGWSLIGAGLVAVAIVAFAARGWFASARLRVVVAVTGVAAGAFATLLALTDGRDGLFYGVEDDTEYFANLPLTPPAGDFVRNFVVDINDYSVHVRGHPPGFIVVLKMLDAVGLSGAWPVMLISLVSTVLMPIGVLIAVWALAGECWVRRSAPFLVVAPYALWMMTSADAFFSALGAWGVAFVALGVRRDGRGAVWLGALAGLFLSGLLFMTYGGAIYLVVPLVIAIAGWLMRRRGSFGAGTTSTVVGAVMMASLVTLMWLAAGFWWFDGAAATRDEYWEGTAQFRIWNYFIFGNVVIALFAIGPASFVGLTKLRDRRLWILVGGALTALMIANLSQLSKAETERIWLLFYPWLVIAGAALVSRFEFRRLTLSADTVFAGWIAVQAVFAILLQAALVSKW
jgi:hypothetical protein